MSIAPSSSGWTIANIILKLRMITGTPGTDELSDDQCLAYLNNYYVFTMPLELKVQIQDQFLQFKTVPGTDVYDFPGGYFTDSPGAYADGFPVIFYQDPDIFFQDWPEQYAVDDVAAGDGVTTNFSGGLQNPPIIVGTLFITDGTQVLQDAGDGTFSGDGSGTIDYLTGAFNVTFTTAPSSGATIYAKYQGYQGNRPQGILFFNNEFTLRPVPDQVYQILMQGYIKPLSLSDSNTTPMQEEWGPLIAYGAALEVFSDRGDVENYRTYYDLFKRQENVALGRTIQQFTAEQAVPRF